jgi:hypothetical protein
MAGAAPGDFEEDLRDIEMREGVGRVDETAAQRLLEKIHDGAMEDSDAIIMPGPQEPHAAPVGGAAGENGPAGRPRLSAKMGAVKPDTAGWAAAPEKMRVKIPITAPPGQRSAANGAVRLRMIGKAAPPEKMRVKIPLSMPLDAGSPNEPPPQGPPRPQISPQRVSGIASGNSPEHTEDLFSALAEEDFAPVSAPPAESHPPRLKFGGTGRPHVRPPPLSPEGSAASLTQRPAGMAPDKGPDPMADTPSTPGNGRMPVRRSPSFLLERSRQIRMSVKTS